MNPFLSEIDIDPQVRSLLADYSIHTGRDVAFAMLDGRLAGFLSDDQRLGLIGSMWSWIRANFPPDVAS